MVKTFKNLLLRNQRTDDTETWYAASSAQVLPSLFKSCPGLTLIYFTAKSNLVPYAFVWEKGKSMDFSETIVHVVYDVKVVRCSLLHESMNLYDYQRSKSFIDIGPMSLRFSIFKLLFLSKPLGRLKPDFKWGLHDMGERRS